MNSPASDPQTIFVVEVWKLVKASRKNFFYANSNPWREIVDALESLDTSPPNSFTMPWMNRDTTKPASPNKRKSLRKCSAMSRWYPTNPSSKHLVVCKVHLGPDGYRGKASLKWVTVWLCHRLPDLWKASMPTVRFMPRSAEYRCLESFMKGQQIETHCYVIL